MIRAALAVDRWTARSRPAWSWLGEIALVTLGIHLAADRLDDLMIHGLAGLDLPWPTPEAPLLIATWTAVAVELQVVAWMAWMLWRCRAAPMSSFNEVLSRLSIRTALAPLAWGSLALVGGWVVAMAVEDAIAAMRWTAHRNARADLHDLYF